MARERAVRPPALVVAILAAASFGGWWLGRAGGGGRDGATYTVTRVVDGDTIVVRGDSGATDRVRLLGVDTPETVDPRKPVQCFGPQASAFTKHRLVGRRVHLEDDVEHHDKYGRRLAYVVIGGARFNDELLRDGYARLLVIPPNGSHARTMLGEELDARRARRGLWGTCEPRAG